MVGMDRSSRTVRVTMKADTGAGASRGSGAVPQAMRPGEGAGGETWYPPPLPAPPPPP